MESSRLKQIMQAVDVDEVQTLRQNLADHVERWVADVEGVVCDTITATPGERNTIRELIRWDLEKIVQRYRR